MRLRAPGGPVRLTHCLPCHPRSCSQALRCLCQAQDPPPPTSTPCPPPTGRATAAKGRVEGGGMGRRGHEAPKSQRSLAIGTLMH